MKVIVLSLSIALLSVSWATAEDSSIPPELEKLRESYQAEIARLNEPVTKRYAESLARLQETYTRAGQLDKALAVKGELDELVQQQVRSKTRLSEKDLDESRWLWGSGGTLTLHRQNKAAHTAWTSTGVWRRIGDLKVLVTKPDGTKFTLVFTDSGLTSGLATSETGGKTTLTRVVK